MHGLASKLSNLFRTLCVLDGNPLRSCSKWRSRGAQAISLNKDVKGVPFKRPVMLLGHVTLVFTYDVFVVD